MKPFLAFLRKDEIIKEQAKKNKSIVYGGQSLSRQLPIPFQRPPFDWDIYSKKPKKSAKQLERKLDKHSEADIYYTKPALYPKTTKVMHKGMDRRKGTKDDFVVADYTKEPRGIESKKIEGVKYTTLRHEEKARKRILKDKKYKFMHRKSREDLGWIRLSRIFRRR